MTGESYDFVIVGSGAASVAAALKMKEAGKSALIIEKREFFGGSTALSGGVIWIPCNSVQREAGVADTPEQASAYLDACAGPHSKGSSATRRSIFLDEGPKAIDFLRAHGMKLVHAETYSDYHETVYPGGVAGSRAIVPEIFDLNELGEDWKRIDYDPQTPALMTHEVGRLGRFGRGWDSKLVVARVGMRMIRNKLFGKKLIGHGNSLQGRLLQIARREQLNLWMETPVTGLMTDGGRVTGVTVQRDGESVEVLARDGVLLNAGGFARNAAMRERLLPGPDDVEWTISNRGDTGEVLQMAIDMGADTENTDLAWWVPGTFPPSGEPHVVVFEYARPHAIVVDQQGERYTNEATSYVQIGLNIWKHQQTAPAVPSWIVMDSRHRQRYIFATALPGKTPDDWVSSGYMKQADTLEELAAQCDLPPDKLKATVERFNGFAREGVDHDFGRGVGAYPHYLGDPTNKPNPSLGTIEKPPFLAFQLWPRDVGTCGGLVTDEHARVLKQDGSVIPGLYATGNTTSSVHGPSYPGAGASIGASLTFGFIAAKHAARCNQG
jgi:3-oxosteroid 1-dehydrogenase